MNPNGIVYNLQMPARKAPGPISKALVGGTGAWILTLTMIAMPVTSARESDP